MVSAASPVKMQWTLNAPPDQDLDEARKHTRRLRERLADHPELLADFEAEKRRHAGVMGRYMIQVLSLEASERQ